jgi:hypothetical protein
LMLWGSTDANGYWWGKFPLMGDPIFTLIPQGNLNISHETCD